MTSTASVELSMTTPDPSESSERNKALVQPDRRTVEAEEASNRSERKGEIAEASAAPPKLQPIEGTRIPLIVFVNSRSGGQQGEALLARLEGWLKKDQIFDLAKDKPEDVLRRLATVADARVLVCGGDGTCGWIMTAMDRAGCKLPMATMPLGTGNDLARTLHWGHGLSKPMLQKAWLRRVGEARPVGLDRWSIRIKLSLIHI